MAVLALTISFVALLIAVGAVAIALSAARRQSEFLDMSEFSMEGEPAVPSELATGDPVLLPPLYDQKGNEVSIEASNNTVGVFTMQCPACEVKLPPFLDKAATSGRAVAIIDAPYGEARTRMGSVVDHPSIVFTAGVDSALDALRISLIPTFLRIDSDGLLADQDTELEHLLARHAATSDASG